MWFKHSMSLAQQLMPIYNTTVHKNMTNVAFRIWRNLDFFWKWVKDNYVRILCYLKVNTIGELRWLLEGGG